jgi:transcription factor IIIB 90 kDa subunit
MQESVDVELLGLDDEELNKFLLMDEEMKIKERVRAELNRLFGSDCW